MIAKFPLIVYLKRICRTPQLVIAKRVATATPIRVSPPKTILGRWRLILVSTHWICKTFRKSTLISRGWRQFVNYRTIPCGSSRRCHCSYTPLWVVAPVKFITGTFTLLRRGRWKAAGKTRRNVRLTILFGRLKITAILLMVIVFTTRVDCNYWPPCRRRSRPKKTAHVACVVTLIIPKRNTFLGRMA